MFKVLQRIPTWEALRPIGRSRISQITIIVPIAGYLILFNKEFVKILNLSEAILGISPEEATSMTIFNLYFLYFGALLFSLSNIIFSCTCPKVIKQFDSEHNFCNRDLEIISKHRINRMIDVLKNRFNVIPSGRMMETTNALERITESNNQNNREFWLRSNSEIIMEILQLYYEKFNHENVWWRLTVSCGYFASLVLMAIPTIVASIRILVSIIL